MKWLKKVLLVFHIVIAVYFFFISLMEADENHLTFFGILMMMIACGCWEIVLVFALLLAADDVLLEEYEAWLRNPRRNDHPKLAIVYAVLKGHLIDRF